jgi:hypothetical protein
VRACCFALVACLVCAAAPARGETLDYLMTFTGFSFRDDLNGIGQTFVATDPFITDASLLLVSPFPNQGPWWQDAHLEVRRGLPQNFDGSSGNVLYRSGVIDFAALPQVGTFDGHTLYELSLSAMGQVQPLPTVPGETYSLVVVHGGTTGYINFANHAPGTYALGGQVGHNRAYANNFWAGPYDFVEMSFRVVGAIPEPTSALVGCSVAFLALARRRPANASARVNAAA